MLSFRQYVTELFDNPYKVQPFGNYPKRKSYKFSLPIPDVIKQENPKLRGSLMYVVEMKQIDDIWEISFEERSNKLGTGKWHDKYNRQYAGGVELKIFASVMEAIKMFVEEYSPDKLVFVSADKEETSKTGRTKLYTRLVSKFAGRMGYDYKIRRKGDATAFFLAKKAA